MVGARLREPRPLLLAAALLLVAVGALLSLLGELSPRAKAPTWRLFTVARGASAGAVAARLQEEGFVRSALATRLLAACSGLSRRLEAGTFLLSPAWSPMQILEALAGDPRVVRTVDISPGTNVTEVAFLLAREGVVGKRAFLGAARRFPNPFVPRGARVRFRAEGFLEPGRYVLPRHAPAKAVLAAMFARFTAEELTPSVRRALAKRRIGVLTWVTLASIVARETTSPRDMPLVAAVFWNRLARHMPLQSDATVLYAAKASGTTGLPTSALRAALRTPSPYNTYRVVGLPPGPIASPGKAALSAVLHPARVGFLFFVVGPDGRAIFSNTYAEQEKAVAELGAKAKKGNASPRRGAEGGVGAP